MGNSAISEVKCKPIQQSDAWRYSRKDGSDCAEKVRLAMLMEQRRQGGEHSQETAGEFYIDVVQQNRWDWKDVGGEPYSAKRGRQISKVKFLRQR